jgi:hypothetical protein
MLSFSGFPFAFRSNSHGSLHCCADYVQDVERHLDGKLAQSGRNDVRIVKVDFDPDERLCGRGLLCGFAFFCSADLS